MAYLHPGYGWKTKLRAASFRGKPFHVINTDTNIGRRNVIHQLPFREDAFSEDLGNDADEFTIRGFVIQKGSNDLDYFGERDDLKTALQTAGPGKLVHPFLGEFNVVVKGKATMTESFEEGGMARFKMTFIKVKKRVMTSSVLPTSATEEIDEGVKSGVEKLKNKFHEMRSDLNRLKSTYYTKNQLVTTVSTAFQMIQGVCSGARGIASSTLSTVRRTIDDALGQITDTVNSACLLAELILDTIDAPLTMIGLPTPIQKTFLGACTKTETMSSIQLPGDDVPGGGVPKDMGESLVNGLLHITRYGESTTSIQTDSTEGYHEEGSTDAVTDRNTDVSLYGGLLDDITISNTNTAARAVDTLYIIYMVKIGALFNACRVAVRTKSGSYEETKKLMTRITDAMDTLLLDMADASASTTYSDYNISIKTRDYYEALFDVKAIFVKAMKEKGASLAKKEDYKVPPVVLPALVLAYDKYDDVTREEEIFDRNRNETIHPGFLPQGEEIDILHE